MGDPSKYAGLVFKSIDQNKTGTVTFGEFLEFLSVLSKGSVEEKMMWSFSFYDVNKDGVISREEMFKVRSFKVWYIILVSKVTFQLLNKQSLMGTLKAKNKIPTVAFFLVRICIFIETDIFWDRLSRIGGCSWHIYSFPRKYKHESMIRDNWIWLESLKNQ